MKNPADERKICGELHILHHLIRRGLDRELNLTGVETGCRIQGMVIGYLYEHQEEPVYQKDIERVLKIRRATASGLLAGMERDGMLLREADPSDGRKKRLILTEKAIQGMEAFDRALHNLDQLMTEGISEEDLDTFLRVAEGIRRNLEEREERGE